MAYQRKRMGPLILERADGTITEWGMAITASLLCWRGTGIVEGAMVIVNEAQAAPQYK